MTQKNVHQRLAAAMAEVKYIQSEQKRGMQYRTVSHDKVTAKVRPALLAAGIVYYPVRCDHTHNGNRAECGVTVRFVNIDAPEDFFEVQTFGYGVDPSDKGPGKAMSYAVKYALLKAMGLETGEDPDEDADTPEHRPEMPAFSVPAALKRILDGIAKRGNMDDLREFRNTEGDTLADLKAADATAYDSAKAAFIERAAVIKGAGKDKPPFPDDDIPPLSEGQDA